MRTKLTLRVDSGVVARSKKVARQRGQSISGIVEEHLGKLAPRNGKELSKQPIANWILEMWKSNDEWKKKNGGKRRNPRKADDKLKYEYLRDKYLRD